MGVSSNNRANIVQREKVGRKEVHSSRKRMCADFLTFNFEDLPAYEIPTVTTRCGEVNLPVLERQVKDFLHIYGRELKIAHTGNNYYDVTVLFNQLKENLPEVSGMELVGSENRQEFIAYKEISQEDFPVMTIFFLPIQIVTEVDDGLRDIMLDFFALLEWKSPFLTPKASVDMRYCLGLFDEVDEFDEENTESFGEDYYQQARRYVRGDINAVFDEIVVRKRSYNGNEQVLHKTIDKKIKAYEKTDKNIYFTPSGQQKQTKELFKIIEQGIALLYEDNIFNYELKALRFKFDDHTLFEYVETDEIFDFDRQFIFCWRLEDDEIIGNLMDIINADAGSISGTVLLNTARITEVKSPIVFSDYPKRWYNWYLKLLNSIYE